MTPRSSIYWPSPVEGALRQGEIVSNLVQMKLTLESLRAGGPPNIDRVVHPLAIVASQDCDLDQDFAERQKESGDTNRLLPGVLFCELIEAATLKARIPGGSKAWDRVRINKDERYQFLQWVSGEQDQQKSGLPELAIDFKRYFTIFTDEIYFGLDQGIRRRCVLSSPYLEHFSSRFCYFQSRVALPKEHASE